MSESQITILVNSCDLYEDAWDPFFHLLKIQWPTCSYDMVLNTETKVYNCNIFNVKTVCSGKKPWSKRLLYCLNQIDTEYVLFFLEDQFLRKPVNEFWWDRIVEYMNANPDVGVIFPRHTGKQTKNYEEDFFPRDYVTDKFRIVGMVALYRRTYLKKILRKHESAWDFELYASLRSKKYDEKVLQYNNKNPEIFVYDDQIQKGYGITQRKWLPRNKELFEKYGIKVNFNNLGIWNPEIKDDTKKIITNNVKTNNLKDSLHNFKKKVCKLPALVKRKYNLFRSKR